jgi:hypothetical protein
MNQLDLSAPIIPGVSAAGYTLGSSLNELTALQTFELKTYLKTCREYHSENVILFLENSTLKQICVRGNYKGTLSSNLGIGDCVKDFEKLYGPVHEGPEDELIFQNLKGLCFEVNGNFDWKNWLVTIKDQSITDIYVFSAID